MKKTAAILIAVLTVCLFTTPLSAYEDSFLNLVSPSGFADWQGEAAIMHRFQGAIDDETLDSFFGTNRGASPALFYRQAFMFNTELKAGYIWDNSEYAIDASWKFTPRDFPVQAQVNLQYFTYEQFLDPEERTNGIMPMLAVQNPPFLERIYLNANLGYDLDKEHFAAGIGLAVKALPSITILGEYYPDLYDVEPLEDLQYATFKEDSFVLGVKTDTYGHQFMLMLTNANGMNLRSLSKGADNNDFRLGFNIRRQFSF